MAAHAHLLKDWQSSSVGKCSGMVFFHCWILGGRIVIYGNICFNNEIGYLGHVQYNTIFARLGVGLPLNVM